MLWTAGFRTAVIGPYEQIQLTEPRGFAEQTVSGSALSTHFCTRTVG